LGKGRCRRPCDGHSAIRRQDALKSKEDRTQVFRMPSAKQKISWYYRHLWTMWTLHLRLFKIVHFILLFRLANAHGIYLYGIYIYGSGVELRVLCLLGRYSATLATTSFCFSYFQTGSHTFAQGRPQNSILPPLPSA
jgi:hypothetical protein